MECTTDKISDRRGAEIHEDLAQESVDDGPDMRWSVQGMEKRGHYVTEWNFKDKAETVPKNPRIPLKRQIDTLVIKRDQMRLPVSTDILSVSLKSRLRTQQAFQLAEKRTESVRNTGRISTANPEKVLGVKRLRAYC